MGPILTAADAGTRHELAVGDQITLELDENPTTGFRWQPALDELALRVVSDDFTTDRDARGAPGRHRFVIEALRPGATELRVRKLRSWEPDDVVDEFVVDLDVSPPP